MRVYDENEVIGDDTGREKNNFKTVVTGHPLVG